VALHAKATGAAAPPEGRVHSRTASRSILIAEINLHADRGRGRRNRAALLASRRVPDHELMRAEIDRYVEKNRFPSDHYPVETTLRWKKSALRASSS